MPAKEKSKRKLFGKRKKTKKNKVEALKDDAKSGLKRATSLNIEVKPKKNVFSRMFGRKKKVNKKRAQSSGNLMKDNEEDFLEGDDLIDHLYKNTQAALQKNKVKNSGFASMAPTKGSGLNNFSLAPTATDKSPVKAEVVTPPSGPPPKKKQISPSAQQDLQQFSQLSSPAEAKQVTFKQQNDISKGKPLGSIRNLLSETENKKGSGMEIAENNKDDSEDDKDTVVLDTEEILKNQYEEIPEKTETNETAVVTPMKARKDPVEKTASVQSDKDESEEASKSSANEDTEVPDSPAVEEKVEKEEEHQETTSKKPKLVDLLRALEEANHVDDDNDDEVELDNIETSLPPPVPKEPKVEPSHKQESVPVVKGSPDGSSKKPRRRRFQEEDEPIKLNPIQLEGSVPPPAKAKDDTENQQVDKIIESLSFTNRDAGREKIDLKKMKDELRNEILADLANEKGAIDELAELRREQEEFKNILEKEKSIKEELTNELSELKEELKSKKRNEKEEDEIEQNKVKEEKLLVEKLLEQNEKQMQRMENLFKESKEAERKIREGVLNIEKVSSVNQRENKELERIQSLTRQIELEQSIILEEQERKQAFELAERERLKEYRDDGLFETSEVLLHNLVDSRYSTKEEDNSLSLHYLWDLVEEKFVSPHFEDAVWFLIQTMATLVLTFFVQSTFFTSSSSSDDSVNIFFPNIGLPGEKLTSALLSQFFHQSPSHLFSSLISLFRSSALFLFSDRKPIIIREVFIASYSLTALFLCIKSVIGTSIRHSSGALALTIGMNSFMITRGLFTPRAFERVISIFVLAFCLREMLFSGVTFGAVPIYLGGSIAGAITAYLACSIR